MASALAADLGIQWDKLFTDPLHSDELQSMMNSRNFTEVFRRVPGFLALMRGTVLPLVEPAAADATVQETHTEAKFVLNRLINHLQCYGPYYTEQFLGYLADTTRNQAVVDSATNALNNVLFAGILLPA